jgi:hypothetical protein
MSKNNQGPPPVPNNKPKGTANESKTTPPPLPKAKIIAGTSQQDETGNAKSDVTTGKKLPPKLPGKKSNTPPPLPPTINQKETGSAIIDATSGKKLPPKLPNRKSKTPPPLAPSIHQNTSQNKFSPSSHTSNTATNGNKGKGKLFLFVIGIVAALIAIISISNGGGNDVPLDRGYTFDYSDNDDSEDSDVGYSEPETYADDESNNYQQGDNSLENTEENVNALSNDLIFSIISSKKICKNCNSKFVRNTGVGENCEKTNSGNEEFCGLGCCQEYYGY